MLYMPSIFGEDLMDRWFDDMDREIARMEKPLYGHNAKNLMRTDVRELGLLEIASPTLFKQSEQSFVQFNIMRITLPLIPSYTFYIIMSQRQHSCLKHITRFVGMSL